MGIAELEALDGEFITLSPNEVEEANELGSRGHQYLRPLGETGKTFFSFSIRLDGHRETKVVFRISASRCSGHYLSDVDGGYWPCCDRAVDDYLRSTIAGIYDVCIRANRQTLDQLKYEDALSLYHIGADGSSLQRYSSEIGPSPCLASPISVFSHPSDQPDDHGSRHSDARALPAQDEDRTSVPRTNKRARHGDIDLDRGCYSYADVANGELETQLEEESADSKIAENLIQKIKKGLKKMRDRKESFDPLAQDQSSRREEIMLIQSVYSQFRKGQITGQQNQNDRETTIEACLVKIDHSFEEAERSAKSIGKQAGLRQWWCWYFSSCIRIVLQDRRQVDRDRKANGAWIIHQIVDNLLAVEGAKALAVLVALAEQTCRLHTAGRTSSNRQLKISTLVANGLRGQLELPPENYQIPNAMVAVCMITGMSHREAVRVLGWPNLAVLDFDEQVDTLGLSRPYSSLSEQWQVFETTRRILHPNMWREDGVRETQASKGEIFAKVVEMWCDEHRLSSRNLQISAGRSRADLFTSDGNGTTAALTSTCRAPDHSAPLDLSQGLLCQSTLSVDNVSESPALLQATSPNVLATDFSEPHLRSARDATIPLALEPRTIWNTPRAVGFANPGLTSTISRESTHLSQEQVAFLSDETITSIPKIMTSLQQEEARAEEMGQSTTAATIGGGWHFVEDFTNDIWDSEFNFNFFDCPFACPDNMSLQARNTSQTAGETSSFVV